MFQLRPSLLLVVLLGAAVLGLSACWGSKKTAPTKSAFLRASSAICKKTNGTLAAAGSSFFSGSSGATKTEADFVKQKVHPIFEVALNRIEGLGAPQGDEDKVKAIVTAGRAALDKLQAHPLLLRADAGSARDPFRDFGRLSQAYGITCG